MRCEPVVVASLCLLFGGRADAADGGGSSLHAAGATDDLVALLGEPSRLALEASIYFEKDDNYESYWRRVVALLDQGADVRAAHARGASVWNVVFVEDPRCACAPYGWEGSVTKKCPNPRYFPGCWDVEMKTFVHRIEVLLDHGVDPNLTILDGDGKPYATPLCNAISVGVWDAIDPLLEHGADVRAWCKDRPALHRAASSADPTLVCKLLERGASIDSLGERGDTALMWAADGGRARNAAILLDYGADPNVRDDRRRDAAETARTAYRGGAAVVRLLRKWAGHPNPTRSLCKSLPRSAAAHSR